MPVQEFLETVKDGGWAVASGLVLIIITIVLALIFAPLVYITVLRGGSAHDRLLSLVRLLRGPKTRRK